MRVCLWLWSRARGPWPVGCETLVRGCREKLQMRNDDEGEGLRDSVVKIPSGVLLRQVAKSAEQSSPPRPVRKAPLPDDWLAWCWRVTRNSATTAQIDL